MDTGENEIVLSFFKANIETRTVPSKAMVQTVMQEYRILKRRLWLTIRAKVRSKRKTLLKLGH